MKYSKHEAKYIWIYKSILTNNYPSIYCNETIIYNLSPVTSIFILNDYIVEIIFAMK